MSENQPEDDRVAAVRAAWEEGFFHISHALNDLLKKKRIPQRLEDPDTGDVLEMRIKTFQRVGTEQKLPPPSSDNKPFRVIRQRFLNVLGGIREFVPDLVSDAEMTPWSIGYVNGRNTEPILIYGRDKEFENPFAPILKARPKSCWGKDIVAGIREHQKEWDDWFVGVSDELRQQEAPSRRNETSRKTIVSVDLQTHQITIEGDATKHAVEPHLARIVNALVQDKIDGESYTKSADLDLLPGCKGKNIPREIKKLRAAAPPLADIIKSNQNGYFLDR